MEKDIILRVENISKQYRLGLIGTGTISHDLNRWWHSIRGKEDPYLKIGESNDRSAIGNSEYAWALKDINFEVQRGEVLGIIGKNGAGKSTLLKILSKVTGPTTGEIKTKGRIASLLEVGTGFHPEMTGKENVFLNGAILGMTKAEINAKLDEIIEFSGCQRYIDTPVKRYSSGMKVRLAFAVAAFLEPDILIVDEVLAVGDAEFQKKAIGKMQEISNGDGRTVLFVSHNMATIKSLTSKCILLQNGNVKRIGDTASIVEEYTTIGEGELSTFKVKRENKKNGLQIKKVSFLNSNNKDCKSFVSGQEIKVKIEVENHDKKTYRKCTIGIGVFDLEHSMLTAFKSDVVNIYYDIPHGVSSFYCELKKIPFTAGVYTYNINVTDFSQVYDSIKQAGNIIVEPGDFYNSGKLPAASHQIVLLNQKWS